MAASRRDGDSPPRAAAARTPFRRPGSCGRKVTRYAGRRRASRMCAKHRRHRGGGPGRPTVTAAGRREFPTNWASPPGASRPAAPSTAASRPASPPPVRTNRPRPRDRGTRVPAAHVPGPGRGRAPPPPLYSPTTGLWHHGGKAPAVGCQRLLAFRHYTTASTAANSSKPLDRHVNESLPRGESPTGRCT